MGMGMRVIGLVLLLLLLPIFIFLELDAICCYNRPPPLETIVTPIDHSDLPQQVHISQVGQDKMRISWITESPSPATVEYGPSPSANNFSATGTTSSYHYIAYESGEIHDVVIGPLKPNTTYYYRLGYSVQQFNFKTPPSQFPIKFAVVGDLGQTNWTRSTLEHISKSNYDMMLLPGDLSYANSIQPLWDSFGRLVEPLASQRPWMVTQGNHDIEEIPITHTHPFTAYNARWRMPFEESGSDSNLYYSFHVAGVHVIMLGSYADFTPVSSQYKWLQRDLQKIDRGKTPWVVVLIHAPWYNSNKAHQGHVHAYERFVSIIISLVTRVYKGKSDNCGPVHITIGDGGNHEGLATKYIPQARDINIQGG
ncbi:Purple acid phosphatase-like, N-terminal [Sesbania bispinosa]|nr:Purple acid phosphatase-like, N-terminal [Sesbania bispinosa]